MKVKVVKENVGLREALLALVHGKAIRYENRLWHYISDEGHVCVIPNEGSLMGTDNDDALLNCVEKGIYDIGELVTKRPMTFDELLEESDDNCEMFCICKTHNDKHVAYVMNSETIRLASPDFTNTTVSLDDFCKTYTRPDGTKFEVEVNDD